MYLRILLVRPMDRRLIFYTHFDMHVMRSHTGSTAQPLHSIEAQTSPANHHEQIRNNRAHKKRASEREGRRLQSREKNREKQQRLFACTETVKNRNKFADKKLFLSPTTSRSKKEPPKYWFSTFRANGRTQNRQIKNYNTCRK